MTNTIEIENLNISDLDIPTDETLQEVATACENIATSSEGIATSCENVASSCGDIAKDTTLQSTNTALGSLATDATLQATNTALGSISGSLSGFATDNTLQAVKGSIDSVASAEGTLNTTLGAVAKDATLQNTNTALGGLNNTLGGIIKDTTGQSIDTSVGSIATVLSDVATDTTLATVAKDTTLQATNTALDRLLADTTGQSIALAISGLGATLGNDRALIDGSNIGDKETFRTNIGLGYLVTTQTFDNLTWTIVKLGNLYFLSTEITIPANTSPATWGSLYVYRSSNKQWWTLPVTLTKKIADLSFTDGSTAGIPIAYTDISSQPNSATTADIARPTTTSSAITVRKFICGYVS